MRSFLLAGATLVACATSACASDTGFDTRQLDLRGFETFRIDQTPFLTPEGCPTPYWVDPAEIVHVGEGEYELRYSVAFDSQEEFESCLQETVDWDDCDHAQPQPRATRRLHEADLAELLDLFASVSVSFAPNPCRGLSDDPCNVNELKWDELEATDRYCTQTEPWVDTSFASEVLRLVTELTQPPG